MHLRMCVLTIIWKRLINSKYLLRIGVCLLYALHNRRYREKFRYIFVWMYWQYIWCLARVRLDECIKKVDEAIATATGNQDQDQDGQDVSAGLVNALEALYQFNLHHFKQEEKIMVAKVEELCQQNRNLREVMQEILHTSMVRACWFNCIQYCNARQENTIPDDKQAVECGMCGCWFKQRVFYSCCCTITTVPHTAMVCNSQRRVFACMFDYCLLTYSLHRCRYRSKQTERGIEWRLQVLG